MLDFFKNKATCRDIESHLQRTSNLFVPELSSYVSISIYSQKIAEKASRIEAWEDNNLVGLLAYYINVENDYAFITNVSVEKNVTQHGVAQYMMDMMINDIIGEIKTIQLEVNSGNAKAISFYKRNGFAVYKRVADNLFMEKCV